MRVNRSHFFPRDGKPADSVVRRDRLHTAKPALDAVIPAVGRVEVTNHPGYTWVGTGWLIGEDVIVTNHHVAREFALRIRHPA
ncbi:MAG TPA: hypothetical protein VE262_03875 [Blastocatellia bacterium]|nr:hypothetical protein [Blastocatellia bacterium]